MPKKPDATIAKKPAAAPRKATSDVDGAMEVPPVKQRSSTARKAREAFVVPSKAAVARRLPGRPRRATSFDPVVAAAFGRVVRAEREKQQIAQDIFALMADIDRSNFGRLERGERQPSLGLVFRIAATLGLPVAGLLEQVADAVSRASKG